MSRARPTFGEHDGNSTYCDKCGCRITIGKCKHGVTPPRIRQYDVEPVTDRIEYGPTAKGGQG